MYRARPAAKRRRLRAVALRSLALRLHGVLGIAGRLLAGVVDGKAQADLTGADERTAEHRRRTAPAATRREEQRARPRQSLRRPGVRPGLALVVDLAGLAEPQPHRLHERALTEDTGDREAARRCCVARVAEETRGGACRRGGARTEDPRQLAPPLVPHGDSRVGDEDARI